MARKIGRTPHDVKVSVNLTPVELGKIDLLRGHGWHSTRSDVIRTALHAYFMQHSGAIDRQVELGRFFVGTMTFTREELERIREKGERLRVRVVGLAELEPRVSPDLAADVFDELVALGVLSARRDVLVALGSRVSTSVPSAGSW